MKNNIENIFEKLKKAFSDDLPKTYKKIFSEAKDEYLQAHAWIQGYLPFGEVSGEGELTIGFKYHLSLAFAQLLNYINLRKLS